MPTFSAPEAYGKKADPKYAQARKDAEEHVAKEAAKKERQKERERRRRRKGKGGDNTEAKAEDDSENWKLFFLIILGIFTALAEALDLDVLIGILLMPFMKAMKYLSEEFDNVNLDPQVWIDAVGNAYNNLCKNHPGGFVQADFTFFVVMVTYFLFQADIDKWWRERNIRAAGYDGLEEEAEGPSNETLENMFWEIDENGSGDISHDEMEGCAPSAASPLASSSHIASGFPASLPPASLPRLSPVLAVPSPKCSASSIRKW